MRCVTGLAGARRMALQLFLAVELARDLADRIAGPPVGNDRTRARVEKDALGRGRRAHIVGAARDGRRRSTVRLRAIADTPRDDRSTRRAELETTFIREIPNGRSSITGTGSR